MIALFARALAREADGSYVLRTPVECVAITVEDAPFVAVALEAAGTGHDQALDLLTNLERRVPVGRDHPIRLEPDCGAGPRPYVALGAGIEALILRPVFYQLVDRGVVETQGDAQVFGVWSRGAFFALGSLEEDPA